MTIQLSRWLSEIKTQVLTLYSLYATTQITTHNIQIYIYMYISIATNGYIRLQKKTNWYERVTRYTIRILRPNSTKLTKRMKPTRKLPGQMVLKMIFRRIRNNSFGKLFDERKIEENVLFSLNNAAVCRQGGYTRA